MADHLPECNRPMTIDGNGDMAWEIFGPCICDRLRQAEQRGFDKGFTDGMTWRIGGPSAVEYWQGQERDRIRTGVKGLVEQPVPHPTRVVPFWGVLAVIDPKEGQ